MSTSTENKSFIVRCRGGDRSGAAWLHIVRVEHAADVRFKDGSFLVRVWADEGRVIERCFIRHIASGREAFVQGGAGLSTFVRECLFEWPAATAEQADGDEIGRSAR